MAATISPLSSTHGIETYLKPLPHFGKFSDARHYRTCHTGSRMENKPLAEQTEESKQYVLSNQ